MNVRMDCIFFFLRLKPFLDFCHAAMMNGVGVGGKAFVVPFTYRAVALQG